MERFRGEGRSEPQGEAPARPLPRLCCLHANDRPKHARRVAGAVISCDRGKRRRALRSRAEQDDAGACDRATADAQREAARARVGQQAGEAQAGQVQRRGG